MSVLQGPGAGRVKIVLPNGTVVGRKATGGVVGITFAELAALLLADVAAGIGAVTYRGTWNASGAAPDQTPAAGDYYIVSVEGTTALSGIAEWKVKDWAVYNGAAWEKVDNTDSVTSVAGRTGAIVLSVSDVSGAEATAQKDANGGYAGLDNGGLLVKPAKLVQNGAPGTGTGAIGVNGGDLLFGEGANQRTVENTSRKGQANGYPSLDGGGKIPTGQLPATVLGAVQYLGAWNANTNTPDVGASSPEQGDYYVVSVDGATSLGGINEWKAKDWAIYNGSAWEKVDNTDAVTSVAGRTGVVTLAVADVANAVPDSRTVATQKGLSGGGDLSGNRTLQIAAPAGLLSVSFDPDSQQYNRNFITTLKTYDTNGLDAHIIITSLRLPPRGNANLKTRILFKFSDNSSVSMENASDGNFDQNAQQIVNFLTGDPAAGQGPFNNGKFVKSVAFEVQNIDANNDYTVDLAAFHIRGYAIPCGGGTYTVTP